MNICKIWDADYPWDIRVEKICESIINAGHTVHLVCRNQARRPAREKHGQLIIHRLPSVSARFGPLHTFCNFPFPINPVWIYKIAHVIRESQADLILVRDILLALPSAILGKIFHIPVILDMAENYPAMLQDRLRYTPTNIFGKIIRHPVPVRWVEWLTLRLVDHVIVVVEESYERLIKAGLSPERLSIVNNTPNVDRWKSELGEAGKNTHRKNAVRLVYLGILDGSRGIDVAIKAIRELKDRNFVANLVVIGDGPSLEKLLNLVEELGVSERVEFTGRLSFSRIQEIMNCSDIGLIPNYSTNAWNSTIPNKLFDYMALGLPVIVSDAKPTARVVLQENCGRVFRDRDVNDLAQCILALGDPCLRQRLGQNGKSAIHRRYNWNYDSEILLKTLESVRIRRRV
jgi:glycosyltransferase involved in cell wall biosynthesis